MSSAKSAMKFNVIYGERRANRRPCSFRFARCGVRANFDRGVRSQFRDQVIRIVGTCSQHSHGNAGSWSAENDFAVSPYWTREKERKRRCRRQSQGLLLMKTSDARWKSRPIRFPIRAAVSDMAQEITLQPFSRDEPAIFMLFSHARSDYRLACTRRRAIVALLLLRSEARLQGTMK